MSILEKSLLHSLSSTKDITSLDKETKGNNFLPTTCGVHINYFGTFIVLCGNCHTKL